MSLIPCSGCHAAHLASDGPAHAYMTSSPACFEDFNTLLAAEYSNVLLMRTHRLTVDTWAVQHPGDPNDRRAVQSVGLHLARLMIQLGATKNPDETNQVMLDFAKHKKTLIPLTPPTAYRVTAKDVAPFAGTDQHMDKVRDWAQKTFDDWSLHHAYIRDWIKTHSVHGNTL